MTKEEAAIILGLSADAQQSDIKKKYNELYNDFQLRLTNAPTPNLKKLYQKNLQELNDALGILLNGGTQGIIKDLPSSSPVFGGESTPSDKGPVNAVHSGFSSQNRPAKSNKEKINDEQLKKVKSRMMLAVLGCVILLAAVVLLVILFNENNGKLAELEKDKEQVEILQNDLERFKSHFSNGKFKVKNYGDAPLTITWLIVSYMDTDGKLKKYEGYVDVTIKPGATEEFSEFQGAKEVWDGTVVSYACGLIYHEEKFYQAGIWSNDSREGNLILNLEGQ